MSAAAHELVILRVNGTQFRCHCGATVFRLVAPARYECNACYELYEGDPQ